MKDKNFAKYDWSLFGIYLALVAMGLANLLSATSTPGSSQSAGFFWIMGHPSGYFKSQFVYVLMGLLLMTVITKIDYRIFERTAYPIFTCSLFLLLLVLIIGVEISGSQRWIVISGFRIQPSEIGKLGLIIVMAKYFHQDRRRGLYGIKELALPLALLAMPMVLLYLEPDLGTALFYLLVAGTMILFVGVKPKPLLGLGITGLVCGLFAYFFLLRDYQQDRILTFLNPQLDPLGKGYHSIQSLIAVGSGRFMGKGYLAGSQSQLKFLPEQHTDFIFSVVAEEWGFVGCLILLLLYIGLLVSGINIAARAKERFGAFSLFGIVAIFFWQIVINVGGVLGLLPITGIPLPFVSYGGSSILTLSIAVGLLQNINVRKFMF